MSNVLDNYNITAIDLIYTKKTIAASYRDKKIYIRIMIDERKADGLMKSIADYLKKD